MVSLLDFNPTSSFGLSAATAMVCPLSSGMCAGRPDMIDGETASSEPVSQLDTDVSHSFPLELPAAQTRIALSAEPTLRHRGDGLREIRAKVGFAVVVGDALDAEAQVQDLHAPPAVPPRERLVEVLRRLGVRFGQSFEGNGAVSAVAFAQGNREHGDVGAPRDALRSARQRRLPDPSRDARNGRAVRETAPRPSRQRRRP